MSLNFTSSSTQAMITPSFASRLQTGPPFTLITFGSVKTLGPTQFFSGAGNSMGNGTSGNFAYYYWGRGPNSDFGASGIIPLQTNKLYCIANVLYNSTTFKGFVNGVLDNTFTSSPLNNSGGSQNRNLYIGALSNGNLVGLYNLNGIVDLVLAYNRALNENEILTISNSLGRIIPVNGLVLKWNCVGAKGTTPTKIIDTSSLGNFSATPGSYPPVYDEHRVSVI